MRLRPCYWNAVAEIFSAARESGIAPGTFCFHDEHLSDYIQHGARLVLSGSDLGWIYRGASRQTAQLGDLLGSVAPRPEVRHG